MIINKTQDKVISNQEIVCKNIFSQARGLMFRRKQNLVMEFPKEKRVSLHNWFVFYPLDVLILDEKMKIIKIKKNFKPFTFWKSKEKGKYVVEMGTSNNYEMEDKIELK